MTERNRALGGHFASVQMTQGIQHSFRNKSACLCADSLCPWASHFSALLISLQVSHQLHLTDLPIAQAATWVGFIHKDRQELSEFPHNMLFYLFRILTTAPSTVWPQIFLFQDFPPPPSTLPLLENLLLSSC